MQVQERNPKLRAKGKKIKSKLRKEGPGALSKRERKT